jgi:hypothetical protein
MKTDAQQLNIPNSLYKYVTADRIDILQNGHIRFTQPSVLNDPFEISADVTSACGRINLYSEVDTTVAC